KTTTPVIPDTQLFGVEIEHFYSDITDYDEARDDLENIDNVNVDSDGSISQGYGMEIKPSGPINLNELKTWVETTTGIIREHSGDVDRSCGLHVHLDIRPFAQDAEKMAQ